MCSKVTVVFSSAEIREDPDEKDYKNGSTDVVVHIERNTEEGDIVLEKYVASFFTYSKIEELRKEHHQSGEYLGGKYFFAKYMILIDNWSRKSVKAVIDHLLEEGDFEEIFEKI